MASRQSLTHIRFPSIGCGALIVLLTQVVPVVASAEIAPEDTSSGVGISATIGVNLCVDRGDAECGSIGPGVGFDFDIFWRLLPYLSIDVGFFLGTSTNDGDVIDYESSYIGVLFGPTAWLPIGPVDLSISAGIGYGHLQARSIVENPEYPASSDVSELDLYDRGGGFAFGWGAALAYRFSDRFSVGATMRHTVPFLSELCSKVGRTDEVCVENPDRVQEFRVGLTLTFYFMDSDADDEDGRERPSGPGFDPLVVHWGHSEREEELLDDEVELEAEPDDEVELEAEPDDELELDLEEPDDVDSDDVDSDDDAQGSSNVDMTGR
jgi:hypothetical protein